jgi:hypothetical protein
MRGFDAIHELTARQHGVVARRQLLRLGLGEDAIDHRLSNGRLLRLERGVYAVGHAELRREGRLIAAVLAAGDDAVLSHRSAAALWGLRPWGGTFTEMTALGRGGITKRPGRILHRSRDLPPGERTFEGGDDDTERPRSPRPAALHRRQPAAPAGQPLRRNPRERLPLALLAHR